MSGAFVPEYIINLYDWYVLHAPLHERGGNTNWGKKSPDERNGYRTRAQTDLFPCELQTGSQSNFRKGVDSGAESVRRDVPRIEKCSLIRSTNLHYSSCYDDERSRPIEKIVTIWLQSADFSSRFGRVGRRPRKMVKCLDFQMFPGPRFSPPGLTGSNKAKTPLDFGAFCHRFSRPNERSKLNAQRWLIKPVRPQIGTQWY